MALTVVFDNAVLEAANEGKVAFIATGDDDLLSLKIFREIQIILASEFLAELASRSK